MRTIRACDRCGSALPKRHSKYCDLCSPLASTLWKRARRHEWRGTLYYLDPWLKKAGGDESEARRLRSEYMREYRIRTRPNDHFEKGHSLRPEDCIDAGLVNGDG